LAGAGDHDFSISRAYYAMFYLALLTLDLEFRRHRAVISALAQHSCDLLDSRRFIWMPSAKRSSAGRSRTTTMKVL